nr:site-specific integrase [uncultured Rhodopila sp.]
MARTVRDAKLETRTARAALKPSGKPYFRAIDEGLHLGYRKGKSAGKWVLRSYAGAQCYKLETIGTADDTIDADGAAILSFSQAQAVARERFLHAKRMAAGGPVASGPYTVRDAINEYLVFMEQNRKSARDTRWRAEALIIPSLGDTTCSKLTTRTLREWHSGLTKVAPRIRTKKGNTQRFSEAKPDDPEEAARRRRSTANRTLTILKAALNHAWREQKIASDSAWRPVRAFKEADAARMRYLTVGEARSLIDAADDDFRKLVRAALLTGARFGELAAAVVADFNPDGGGTLQIRTSKSGKGRHIVLNEEGTAFFEALTADRSEGDQLISKAGGGRWLKSHQTRPMKDACRAAKINPPVNFHVLRHTYASLMIMNGAPLMVVARNLGHADTRMVEKHYGHLAKSFIAEAIRAAAPRFSNDADPIAAPVRAPQPTA